jgi:two-component system, LuxR family, response regulator FixJ
MTGAIVSIVDDDADVRDSLQALLESAGFEVRSFDSARKVLDDPILAQSGCLIADIRMPDMDGLTLQEELVSRQIGLPVIVVTGHGDVPLAVRAMRAGAIDFMEKPFDDELLIDSVKRALSSGAEARSQASLAQAAKDRIDLLTEREREVLERLVAGRRNKVIGYELDISPRTVEIHRANLMVKIQARSLSDVVRLAIAAGLSPKP